MSDKEPHFKHLTVIGTGLLGGSLMMACREMYPDLVIQAVDLHSETLQFALKNKIADEVSLTLPEAFEENHLIVIATHLDLTLKYIEDLAPLVKDKDVVVSDMGSCKRRVCELGESLLPGQFIGGHPIAGREVSGIENATDLLFSGKPYILCPPKNITADELDQKNFKRLGSFIEGLKVKLTALDPDTHDKYMAYVSHLPQIYAILLTNLFYRHHPGHLLAFHGTGVEDQMRLAASPYDMWSQVFDHNEDNIREVMQQFMAITKEFDEHMRDPVLNTWFDHAKLMNTEFYQFMRERQLSAFLPR